MPEFTHLHLHTEHCLLDGACGVKTLFERVSKIGQIVVAMADHSDIYGWLPSESLSKLGELEEGLNWVGLV